MWPTCAANCAIRAARESIARSVVYQSETDCYHVAGREVASRHRFVAGRGYCEVSPKRGTCARCSLRQFCTRDKNGHTLKRYAAQELFDKARNDAIRRKLILTEGVGNGFKSVTSRGRLVFSTALSRARWRGLWRQGIQDCLESQPFKTEDHRQKAERSPRCSPSDLGQVDSLSNCTPQLFLPTTHRSHLFTT